MKINAKNYDEYITNGENCFEFEAEVVSKIKGFVWAKNFEEALELISKKQWDEIEEGKITEVENVLKITEEK